MNKALAACMSAGLILLCGAPHASASDHSRGANPHGLDYTDIEMDRPDFDEPFQRDGRTLTAAEIAQVVPGTTADQVRVLLGDPVRTGQGARGPEWDYNLKLGLADHDFIVCQYKVVLDPRGETVVETVWRRYQCRDEMAAHTAAAPR